MFMMIGCAQDNQEPLLKANARKDALAAVNRGEIFLYGAQGPSLFLPGIPRKDYKEYIGKFEIRMIEGTSDAYFGKDFGREQVRRHLLAVEYAEIFNLTILEHVKKNRSGNKAKKPTKK